MLLDSGSILGRGFAFPPHIGEDGRFAFSAGAENVRQAMQLILLTEPGERRMLPEFGGGLKRFLFEPNTVATRRRIQETIVQALGRWEPRVRLQTVTVEEHPQDRRVAVATIRYQLVATGTSDQLQLQVRLTT